MIFEGCGSNPEICGYFSDINGIGQSLNKIVKTKNIVHAFTVIYLSTVTQEHYARG